MDVLVLGGAGFLGRHVVTALEARGHRVIVGGRAQTHTTAAGRRYVCARFERLIRADTWTGLLSGVGAVVNCVGILRQRGRETYGRVHADAPAALAAACNVAGVPRLVHVSALGLAADARSGFIRSKRLGERVIGASGAPVTIVRPSLLHGEGGFGARWLTGLARLALHAVPEDAAGRIAVVDVRDVAEAIAILCERDDAPAVVELGGPVAMTMRGYLAALRAATGRPPARVLAVSRTLSRIAAHACDAVHLSPFSFGHLELMRRDNVPGVNALQALLGRAPRAVVVGDAAASARGDAFHALR